MPRSPPIEYTRQLVQADGYLPGGGSDTNFQYAYTYDAIGNYTQTTAQTVNEQYYPNNLNQYTNTTTRPALTYDPNGNLLDDSQLTYGWDQESRLVLVSNVDAHVEFAYNGLGWKVEQRAYTNGMLVTTTRYMYDGVLPVVETDESNATVRTITRGLDLSGSMQGAGGIGGLLSLTTISATTNNHYYFYDGNGNVVDMIDESDASVAHYEYDSFGQTRTSSGSLSSQPYRFSSKEHVDAAGLYYYGYRFYSPQLGRWLSRDPIKERGGLNLYRFLRNNPINMVDLFGLKISNNTGETIYVKPEEGGDAIAVAPGQTYEGEVDGVTVPDGQGGQDVYKITDPFNDSDIGINVGDVDFPGPDFISEVINKQAGGGLMDTAPDTGWDAIFDAADDDGGAEDDEYYEPCD